MGKSHKKVKSDRINALRKQYEAFLEEDKKRKERNDYILGKLYNMRSSNTAVVPQCTKPIVLAEGLNIYDRRAQPERALVSRFPYPRPDEKHQDESTLLRDIVKKYILIPKRESHEDNDLHYNKQASNVVKNQNENDDWQSKYDILKQLKKNEKEGSTELTLKEKESFSHEPLLLRDQRFKSGSNAYIKQNFTSEQEDKIPQKDLSDNKTDIQNYSEIPGVQMENELILEQTEVADHANTEGKKLDSGSVKYEQYDNSVNELQNPIIGLSDTKQTDKEPSFVVKDDNNKKTYLTTEETHSNSVGKLHENIENLNLENKHEKRVVPTLNEYHEAVDDKDTYENTEKPAQPLHADDWDPIEIETTTIVATVLNKDAPPTDYPIDAEEGKFPIDIINAKEFTPHDDVQLEHGENRNPEFIDMPRVDASVALDSGIETNAVPDPDNVPVEITGNEELEEEQKMFYEEAAIENVVQESSGDTSNTEYVQNVNEQYSYYEGEGVQPELPPVEVNEYEETSTRYDQNYEQQYANTYEEQGYVQPEIAQNQDYEQYPQGYEENTKEYAQQPEGYVQHPEEYAQHPPDYEQYPVGYKNPEGFEQYPQGDQEGYQQYPEGYEQPQGYTQQPEQEGYDQQYQQQNYEAPEQIEQQLDNELGYVKKQEVEEKPDVQEKQEAQSVGPQ